MSEHTPNITEKKSPGDLLKQQRLEQGISLETIHEETKIPMDALRGIEEGYHPRTLTPFYVKGFIKMYAKYLDISLDEIPEDSQSKKTFPKPAKPVKKETIPDIDIQLWVSHLFTRKRKKQIFSILGILLALFVLFKIITAFTHKKPSAKTSKTTVAKRVVPEKKKVEKKVPLVKKAVIEEPPKPVIQKTPKKTVAKKLPILLPKQQQPKNRCL